MQITMAEIFRAFGGELLDAPIIRKTATGPAETAVFKGGLMARLNRGKLNRPACVWLPDEAKEINKIVGAQIFTADSARFIIKERNNCNTILFQQKGDVSILWSLPDPKKIIDKIFDDLEDRYKMGSFVGYTLMITLTNIGHDSYLLDNDIYPELIVRQTNEDFENRLKDDLGYIATALSSGFVTDLFKRHGYTYIGFDDSNHYLRNTVNEIIKIGFYRDEYVDAIRGDLPRSIGFLIDDIKPAGLQS